YFLGGEHSLSDGGAMATSIQRDCVRAAGSNWHTVQLQCFLSCFGCCVLVSHVLHPQVTTSRPGQGGRGRTRAETWREDDYAPFARYGIQAMERDTRHCDRWPHTFAPGVCA